MTPEARQALCESIAHWRRMVDDPWGVDEPDAEQCSLCAWYGEIPGCEGCPIAAATGHGGCEDTPYHEARGAWDWMREHPSQIAETQFRYWAGRMLAFLESLKGDDT